MSRIGIAGTNYLRGTPKNPTRGRISIKIVVHGFWILDSIVRMATTSVFPYTHKGKRPSNILYLQEVFLYKPVGHTARNGKNSGL